MMKSLWNWPVASLPATDELPAWSLFVFSVLLIVSVVGGIIARAISTLTRQASAVSKLSELLPSQRKIKAIETFLKRPNISREEREAIASLLSAHDFKRMIGIYAEAPLRKALIEFHHRHRYEVTWQMLSAVGARLSAGKTGPLQIQIYRGDLFFHYYLMTVFFLVLAFAVTIMLLTLLALAYGEVQVKQLLAMFAAGLLVAGAGMVTGKLDAPYHTAKRLRELGEINNVRSRKERK